MTKVLFFILHFKIIAISCNIGLNKDETSDSRNSIDGITYMNI